MSSARSESKVDTSAGTDITQVMNEIAELSKKLGYKLNAVSRFHIYHESFEVTQSKLEKALQVYFTYRNAESAAIATAIDEKQTTKFENFKLTLLKDIEHTGNKILINQFDFHRLLAITVYNKTWCLIKHRTEQRMHLLLTSDEITEFKSILRINKTPMHSIHKLKMYEINLNYYLLLLHKEIYEWPKKLTSPLAKKEMLDVFCKIKMEFEQISSEVKLLTAEADKKKSLEQQVTEGYKKLDRLNKMLIDAKVIVMAQAVTLKM